MLTTNNKIMISLGSIITIALIGIVRMATGNKDFGVGWIKEYPVHFSIMIGVVVIYLVFMFFMFRKIRK
jgi:hypothetical protein